MTTTVKRQRIDLLSVKQVKDSSQLYNVERRVSCPDDVYKLLNVVLDLQSEASEKFGILNLNTKNQINGIHILSAGSLNSSIVHPREVFKAAILNNSATIICFHNHPSGDPTPSQEDIQLTKRLISAGEIIGIEVLDHMIIGENRFCSMKELGIF